MAKKVQETTYTGSDGQTHARFVAGPADFSPTVRVAVGGYSGTRAYDSSCSGCYLGNAHSEAYHDRATRKGTTAQGVRS